MRGLYFFFGLTKQWLNHDGKSFYRGSRGPESEWSVMRVGMCKFTLTHVATGITYGDFNLVHNRGLYQILIQSTQGTVLAVDTDSINYPQSNTIILWPQLFSDENNDEDSDNNVINNQLWQIVLDVGNVQLYNTFTNSYLTYNVNNNNNQWGTTNNCNDTHTVWNISNNVLHHLVSNTMYKIVDYNFITPLDLTVNIGFTLTSEGPETTTDISDVNTNHETGYIEPNIADSYEVWSLLPTTLNPIAENVKPLRNITIATINVEAYEESTPDEIAARILSTLAITSNTNNSHTIENKFNSNDDNDQVGVDVICVQEDRLIETMYIAGYKKVIFCLAEVGIPCTEDRKTGCIVGIKAGTEYLINSIYVKSQLITAGMVKVEGVIDITDKCEVPRCATFITIGNDTSDTNSKPITIANTHICGGRFDDKKFKDIFDVKSNEITDVIAHNPTIIVGDFNGGYNHEIAKHVLSGYDVYRDLSSEDKELFIRYYTSTHTTLIDSGYEPAYNEYQIGKTSVYGGIPDWIYYLPDVLVPTQAHTVNFTDINGKRLTDHNAVYVSFSII